MMKLKKLPKFGIKSILILGLSCLPLLSSADIPSDKTAKMYITSDYAELSKSTGVSIFTGNVKVDRGSTHLTADKLTTYSNQKNQLIKIIAESTGNGLATYETLTAVNKPPLEASAQMIQYDPQKHYVILRGKAFVKQGADSISGPQLEYDITKQLLVSKTVTKSNTGRTQIIVQPDGSTSIK